MSTLKKLQTSYHPALIIIVINMALIGSLMKSWSRSYLQCTSLPVCTVCAFFHNTCLLLPRCPDGYFGPRCLQTEPLRLYMPNPFKSMFTCHEQQRTETQLALDYLCGPSLLPLLLLPSSSSSFSYSFSGRHPASRALHRADSGVIHSNTLLLLSVVILLV